MSQIQIGDLIRKRFKLEAQLGAGAYGTVFKVLNVENGQFNAMKVYKKEARDRLNESFIGEKKVLEELKNIKGVPVLEDDFVVKGYQCLVLPIYIGDLESLKTEPYMPKTTLKIGAHLIEILQDIHDAGFLHRDLKLSNLMIPHNQRPSRLVIIDFGLACRFKIQHNGKRGPWSKITTPVNDVDFKSSVYAAYRLGHGFEATEAEDVEMAAYCLLMCRNILPFSGNPNQLMKQKLDFKNDIVYHIPNSSIFLVEVLETMLKAKPGKKPQYGRILDILLNDGYHIDMHQFFSVKTDEAGNLYIK